MKVFPVPCLEDNYAYILHHEPSNQVAWVDPVEPEKLLETMKRHSISPGSIKYILTTHHHLDHAGGNFTAKKLLSNVEILGGDDRIQGLDRQVSQGENIGLGSANIHVLSTPCHTRGHVCYHVTDGQESHVFTGDTLFIGGCGKFFEGTAMEMHRNLEILGKLSPSTKVWVGHEYTKSNLIFCQHVEPDNQAISTKLASIQSPTVPSTIANEHSWNVFMRVSDPATGIMTKLGISDPILALNKLRDMKNSFKPLL